ncbi:sugar ABC transporter ATP-binding protein [Faecalicatena contorta]|uniref:Ribose/galactose/methyl galactoside import ATP-binding protein n=1 Tax=Faecalicatena contorta TaxID=39482 RepID=A0A315ZWV2_9FIRM|nr:sugar ABC transporter ATP-binding protein [Faecalicatena contorta]PWJ50121.1 methyl-galactoside transport system ATP-binding protein/inositol transport system ATP-binding protein [Faecalicatena contorta]SUQ14242.1 methyl-galactoside transport system ATP-binding protein/inositol transport system ATP-binding protein [Faecalicatena contorta]
MSEKYILEMQGIVKEFPGVKALNGVQLKVRPGTVHTLMGENGAGKSTLMKCLIGMYAANAGTITYKGRAVKYKSTEEALNDGISMIHQELSPVLERSVSENVWLGREPKKGIFIDYKKMRQDCLELFGKMGVDLNPDEKMKNLTVAKMQMVEIVKAISYNSSIVIMDEPTSALTDSEVEDLFRIIAELKAKDVAVIYISHKMDEIFRISDDISIFRDGTYISTDQACNLTQDEVIKRMVGREITEMFPKEECEIGEVILRVDKLSSGKAVKEVSFELHKGEILGFAGLVGAGRTETMETIFGMRPKTGGAVYINGKKVNIKSPEDAAANKIALLTEDRRGNGILGILSVRFNTVVANLKTYGFPVDSKKMAADTQEYIDRLSIKTPSMDAQIQDLSGGNQQKVLLGRWLLTDPDILIVDEPTRGIDVGAKAEIHRIISDLAKAGKAIIVVSSELPEVMGVSDRVVIMHEGRVTGVLDRCNLSQELIMKYATKEEVESKSMVQEGE